MIALASSKKGIQVCRWPLAPLEVGEGEGEGEGRARAGKKGVSQPKLVERREETFGPGQAQGGIASHSLQPGSRISGYIRAGVTTCAWLLKARRRKKQGN